MLETAVVNSQMTQKPLEDSLWNHAMITVFDIIIGRRQEQRLKQQQQQLSLPSTLAETAVEKTCWNQILSGNCRKRRSFCPRTSNVETISYCFWKTFVDNISISNLLLQQPRMRTYCSNPKIRNEILERQSWPKTLQNNEWIYRSCSCFLCIPWELWINSLLLSFLKSHFEIPGFHAAELLPLLTKGKLLQLLFPPISPNRRHVAARNPD